MNKYVQMFDINEDFDYEKRVFFSSDYSIKDFNHNNVLLNFKDIVLSNLHINVKKSHFS